MLTRLSRMSWRRGAPLLLALSFSAVACSEQPEAVAPSLSAQITTLDALVTSDDPRALQVPTTPLSENGADIFAVGGGQSNLGTENFDLSAHTGPQGDFGHWGETVYDLAGQLIVRYRIDVNCVHIHGMDRGIIRGVVDKVEPTPNALGITLGETILLAIKDGGQPSAGPVDSWFDFHRDVFPAVSCKNIFLIFAASNVNQGNVLVKMN